MFNHELFCQQKIINVVKAVRAVTVNAPLQQQTVVFLGNIDGYIIVSWIS